MMSRNERRKLKARRLTERQEQTLEAIREHVRREGRAPTRAELAAALGLQHQSAVGGNLGRKLLQTHDGYSRLAPRR